MGDHAAEEQNSEEQDRDLAHICFMLVRERREGLCELNGGRD